MPTIPTTAKAPAFTRGKLLHEMTYEEFEKYLRKNKITGMAAFEASSKRRRALLARLEKEGV